jgi:TetR/AcrR family transcriptional regulator
VVNYRKPARKRRAVTDVLKVARRDAILVAAQALFCKEPFESIAMSDIAAAAGLAKGTLYLYFRTREEIFLALLTREYSSWLAAFARESKRLASPEATLDWIAASFAERREFVHLAALLHAVLERNLPIETARDFKLAAEIGIAGIAPDLARALRLEGETEARRFLRWLQVCVVGVHQLSSPTPAVRAAMAAEPRLAGLVVDFQRELRVLLGALHRGIRQTESSTESKA